MYQNGMKKSLIIISIADKELPRNMIISDEK